MRAEKLSILGVLFAVSSMCFSSVSLPSQTISFDLRKYGLEPKAFKLKKPCYETYMGYWAVRWLDAQDILIAFNTSPVCPNTDDYVTNGTLRLISLDIEGNLRHEKNLDYDSAMQAGVVHDGIWLGPQDSVLVESPYIPAAGRLNSAGRVRVLTAGLEPIQEIETESDSTTEEYGTFTHYGTRFEGVTADRATVSFSKDTGKGRDRTCLIYKGIPLRQTGECSPHVLSGMKLQLRGSDAYQVPTGWDATEDYPDHSSVSGRSSIIITRHQGALCQLAGAFCPSGGRLLVYDSRSKAVLFSQEVSLSGRAALSPDGKHLAVLAKEKLNIIEVP